MKNVLPFLFAQGKLLFALAFMMPLFAQIMERTGVTPPFGLSPLLAGAILAAALGLTGKMRGRWI